jgi:Flp pilus assembly pilin Flp
VRFQVFKLRPAKDVSGQTTVEYVLTLAFSVFVFVTFFVGVLKPALTRAWQGISTNLSSSMSGANLHQLTIGH